MNYFKKGIRHWGEILPIRLSGTEPAYVLIGKISVDYER
jgi:hypothetical protein